MPDQSDTTATSPSASLPHGVEGGGKLLPCPFCGGAPTHFDDPDHSTGWVIYCMANKDCLIHDRELWGKTKADVFAAWNTRSLPTGPDNA